MCKICRQDPEVFLLIRAWPNWTLVLELPIAMVPTTSPNHAGHKCAKSATKIQMFLLVIPICPKALKLKGGGCCAPHQAAHLGGTDQG